MSFMELKKDELVKAARLFHVDHDADATKAEITAALADSGVSFEEYEAKVNEANSPANTEPDLSGGGPTDSDAENERADAEVVKVDREARTPVEEAPQASAEKVLLRFTGNNLTYRFGGKNYSRTKPFFAVTPEEADRLTRAKPGKFRPANAGERKALGLK